ncbi:MAG: NAD(P)H-dependent oxidoreductase, partial [Clostridia bacterium]|nr:NAD(P)H-dependent oxidoreductase [Clostridia bacterium]
FLRAHPAALEGSCGAFFVDGESELYTKELARRLAQAANAAGCRLMGRPLVEATKSLKNFDVLSGLHNVDRYTAYRNAAEALVARLADYAPKSFERPRVLMLHASDAERSNTLAIGRELAAGLSGDMELRELMLSRDAIYDCKGCGHTACAHFAGQESCFYGGLLPEAVFPAIMESDALLLLCPNYNDAPGAHFAALVNRLNALILRGAPMEKDVFAVVVSGYSGGDIVAAQLIDGFCLNKGFSLPPYFALLETANDPGEALSAPGAFQRIADFQARMREALLSRRD